MYLEDYEPVYLDHEYDELKLALQMIEHLAARCAHRSKSPITFHTSGGVGMIGPPGWDDDPEAFISALPSGRNEFLNICQGTVNAIIREWGNHQAGDKRALEEMRYLLDLLYRQYHYTPTLYAWNRTKVMEDLIREIVTGERDVDVDDPIWTVIWVVVDGYADPDVVYSL